MNMKWMQISLELKISIKKVFNLLIFSFMATAIICLILNVDFKLEYLNALAVAYMTYDLFIHEQEQ